MSLTTNDSIRMPEMSAPSTPPSGSAEIYIKSDKKPYIKDSTGVETQVGLVSVGTLSSKPGILRNNSYPYEKRSFDWFVSEGLGKWATVINGEYAFDATEYPDIYGSAAPSYTRGRVFRFGSTWGALPGSASLTLAQSTTDLLSMTNRTIPAFAINSTMLSSWHDETNGYYVAIVWGGYSYVYSSDGITWSFCPYIYAASSTSVPSAISQPVVQNGTYSFYDSTRGKRYYTTDHVTFNQADVANTLGANVGSPIHLVNGLLFCIPASTTTYYTSADGGVTWTSRTWPSATAGANTVPLIVHNGTNYLFTTQAATSNTSLYTSPDLVTWTNRTCAFTAAITIQRLAVANSVFFAFSSVSQTKFCTSPDGITWTERTAASASAYGLAVYVNSKYMIMSTSRTEGSTALVTWAAETTSGPNGLSRLCCDTYFVASGNRLAFATSAGVWTAYDAGVWSSILTSAQVSNIVSKTFYTGGTNPATHVVRVKV